RAGHAAHRPRRARGLLPDAARHDPRSRDEEAPRVRALLRVRGGPLPRAPRCPPALRRGERRRAVRDPRRARGRLIDPLAPRALEVTVKYMLLIYEDDADRVAHMDERMPTCFAYAEAMKKAGIYVAGEPLRAVESSTTVRVVDGKTHVFDGPYVEAKEQLGG